jgi:tetratricopeptide (TPR) repeat protein
MKPSSYHLRTSIPRYPFWALALLWVTLGCQPKAVTKARMYIQNSEWQLALDELERAVEVYPDNEEAHFLLGFVYGQNSRYQEMVAEFDSSLKISDKFEEEIRMERGRHWKENFNQGIKAVDVNDLGRAERMLQKAIVIDSSKHDAHKRLATTYMKNDRLDEALEIYTQLLKIHPNEISLLLAASKVYLQKNQLKEAANHLEEVLHLEPQHRDGLSKLAEIADVLGQYEKAQQTYRKAVATYPHDRELILRFGIHHYQRSNFERSIQLFERVLELDAGDFEAISNIGNAYLSLAENLRKQLKKSNNGSHRASDLQKMRDRAILNYQKSIPYLKKAVDMQPNLPNLWRNLGVAYIQTGQKQKGEEAFIKSDTLTIDLSK